MKSNKEIYLIPEFCFITGLSDEMRSNFNLMKTINTITKVGAQQKLEECLNLLNSINQNEKCKSLIESWKIDIQPIPLAFKGTKLNAGNILMGKGKDSNNRYSINIDRTPDLDRKIQNEMYYQPSLVNWLLFSTEKDKKAAEIFIDNLNSYLGQSLLEELSFLPDSELIGTNSDSFPALSSSSTVQIIPVNST